jgi:hypothetical protein
VRQVLGDTTGAVTPDARQPEHLRLIHTHVEENRNDPDDFEILLTDTFLPTGTGQAERHVDTLERRERHAHAFAYLGEGPIRARVPPTRTLEVPKRQVAGAEGSSDCLGLDPDRVEVADRPRAHDVSARKRALV